MRNRIKNLHKNIPDIETLLKDAQNDLFNTFGRFDLTEMTGKVLASWKVDFQTIMLCEKRGNDELLTDKDVDDLITILNTANKILKDPDAPDENKALLIEMYVNRLIKYYLSTEKYHGEKLFERRAEIEKDNPLRDFFIVRYVDNLVYPRFYAERSNKRDEELKAKGITDLDTYYEEEAENLTHEEAEKENREWQEHYNDLLREYGEGHLIGKPDPFIFIQEWRKKLPEDIRKDIEARGQLLDREGDIICKIEELKETRGITDNEALKLLTDEEREILKKGGLYELEAGDTPIS